MVKHLLATSPHIHTAMPFTLACQAKPSTPSSSANAWHLFPAHTPPPQARAEQEDVDEVRLGWDGRPDGSSRPSRSVFGHQHRDHLVSVAAVDEEIIVQGENDGVVMQFGKADEAGVGQ